MANIIFLTATLRIVPGLSWLMLFSLWTHESEMIRVRATEEEEENCKRNRWIKART